jgi:prephenate dehydratase
MRVAIQGEVGSFHDTAVRQFFGDDTTVVPCATFRSVFEAIHDGSVETGLVAVENSLYGSIHETYDQLLRYDYVVTGELQLQIHQQLIAKPNSKISDIREVWSHPAALDQCRNYINKALTNAIVLEHSDTAGAVAEIAKLDRNDVASIASSSAARLYNMTILAENIEDEPDNITRFLAISSRPEIISDADKASIVLTTDHSPGALYLALGVFDNNKINLTKLESRQVRGRPFEYQFILDITANQAQLITLLHELDQLGYTTQLLGHAWNFLYLSEIP